MSKDKERPEGAGSNPITDFVDSLLGNKNAALSTSVPMILQEGTDLEQKRFHDAWAETTMELNRLLSDACVPRTCTVCAHDSLGYSPMPIFAITKMGSGMLFGSSESEGIPMLVRVCDRCTNTQLFMMAPTTAGGLCGDLFQVLDEFRVKMVEIADPISLRKLEEREERRRKAREAKS